ncbi:glycerophosphodiester phosphodiesterase [Salinicoccus albus]|uniref:glycerophosphodiester phosphodiesterase n=1 Tax=Salinicoccus albus TaxID=418756 RepID=UPI000375EF72|nr:glycerophosphodiester phosphodiesterase [Salinicoccus albus]
MTKVFGHRGAMGTYPENTMLAFKKAVEMGVDGLEIDVHLTRDGEIVVLHDEYVDRTTDGFGAVKDMTLEEIRQLSAGSRFNEFVKYAAFWDKERIPLLSEVLTLVRAADIELNIELKTSVFLYNGIEAKLNTLVREFDLGSKVIYSSVHLPSLKRMKDVDPNVRVAWLSKTAPPMLCDYISTFDLDAFHIYGEAVLAEPERVKGVEDKVRVWTVNHTENAQPFIEMEIGTIMTDYPEEIIALLEA